MITTMLNTIPDEPFIVSILLLHVKAFIVLSAAYIASEGLWRCSASQRFAILACGFVAIACIPLFKVVAHITDSPAFHIERTIRLDTLLTSTAATKDQSLGIHQLFFIFYATGVLWHLAKIALSLSSVIQLLRYNRPASYQGQRYSHNGKTSIPFSFGTIRPIIVLPKQSSRWDDSMMRAVLAHEQAHCERRDWLVFLFAKLICAVFWLAPWVWQAERKLRRLAENACDDAALNNSIANTQYASVLLRSACETRARSIAEAAAATVVPAFHGSELRLRIEHVLQDDQSRQALTPGFCLVSVMLFTLLSLLLGSVNAQASWQDRYDFGLSLLEHPVQQRNADNSPEFAFDETEQHSVIIQKPSRPAGFTLNTEDASNQIPEQQEVTGKLSINVPVPAIDSVSLPVNVAVQGRVPRVMAGVQYPKAALRRGIEGYVIVRFTIDEQGKVSNPSVLQSQPKNIFDSSALEAIRKFKYTPLKIGGVATSVEGVLNRFVYQLSDKPIDTPNRSIPFKGTTLIALHNSS